MWPVPVKGGLKEKYGVLEIIDEAEDHLESFFSTIKVEIILPIELLHWDLENWETGEEEDPSPLKLGTEYQLMIRSFERLYDRRFQRGAWHSWSEKWKARPQTSDLLAEGGHILWAYSSADLMGNHFHSKKPAVVALLPIGKKEFRKTLKNGFPVVLWPRQKPKDSIRAQELIHEVICCVNFDSFPKRLQMKRYEGPEKLHWGEMGLIWDNPEELPPDVKTGRHS